MNNRDAARENAHDVKTPAKIQIQCFGSIRAAAERFEAEVEFTENGTIMQLLLRLADVYGEGFRDEIFAQNTEKLRDDLTVSLNGAIIQHAAAEETILRPGDALALFPLFPGGG